MANPVRRGFWPVRRAGGGRITYERVRVASAYATIICAGDLVRKEGTNGTFERAAAGESIWSVCVGVSYVNADSQRVESLVLPASTSYSASGFRPSDGSFLYIVEDAFNVIFETQMDGIMDQNTSDETLNYDMVQTATATAVLGSQQELNETTAATTTAQMRLVAIVEDPSNDTSIANAKVLCSITESQAATAQTATAVGTA